MVIHDLRNPTASIKHVSMSILDQLSDVGCLLQEMNQAIFELQGVKDQAKNFL